MSDGVTLALEYARKAAESGEVPIGAVVLKDGQIIGAGANQKEGLHDPTAHAEIIAIRQAAMHLGDWRLNGCILACTLEPCPMCAGAILQSRLDEVIFGAKDLRWGAAGTIVDLLSEKQFNHHCTVTYVANTECEIILKDFFRKRRA